VKQKNDHPEPGYCQAITFNQLAYKSLNAKCPIQNTFLHVLYEVLARLERKSIAKNDLLCAVIFA